ncbi:mannose-P-dolichol utilization defect 1 protein homolog [Agrilus planipennis]|uniref:Solute carrier family 66 member 3 n=1 Tax=Agrilus planipennis TaxID=224129 RepID=A0A1W4X3F3_AGRPL|nr:mannose-P-dolichol utilization defect 1 protein homolog [Agrilus planipennis]
MGDRSYVKDIALLLFSPACYDQYFLEFNFLDVNCFKATLSKCLGVGIILGSLLVKIPQILKILKNKSAQGISLFSVTFDLIAITIYMAYSCVNGFPFTSWGDTAFLALQTVAIGFLVLFFGGSPSKALIYLLVYASSVYVLISGITPINVLWTLQGFNIPILLSGKLLQAHVNYKNGHTGQLAAVTLIMLFAGSLARIFTSIQETGDTMSIITYAASSFANAVLVYQLFYYWNVDINKKKK